jgi:hypothetical protein
MPYLVESVVLLFSRRRQPQQAAPPEYPATKSKGGVLHSSDTLISLAQRIGIDTSAEKAMLDQAFAMTDPAEVYHIEREILASLSEKIIAHVIKDMKKRTLVTEEIEHMLRSAKADYLLATPESLARAEETIRKAMQKAETIRSQYLETKKRLDEILDILSSGRFTSERMKIHHEKMMKQIEDAIDLLLEDKIYHADNLLRSVSDDLLRFVALQERAKHALDKAILLLQELSELGMKQEVSRMEKILISSKVLIDAEEFESAYTAANSIIYLAKEHLPESRQGAWEYVCPICFSEVCPDCGLKINGGARCHLGCECGTGYHLCCISRHANFPCVTCGKILNKKSIVKPR